MTATPPPTRLIPARPEWLEGWCGPVEWLDTFRSDHGNWIRSAYGAGGMANGAPAGRILLDPSRPEVRDLLARRLSLPDSHRIGEWATPMCWWAGMTGRAASFALDAWVSPWPLSPHVACRMPHGGTGGTLCVSAEGWYVFNSWRGPETADAGKLAADTAALAHDCAILTGDGAILLPPLVAGGPPILWSQDA